MVHPSARPPSPSALDSASVPPKIPSPTHSLSPMRLHSDPLGAHPNDMSPSVFALTKGKGVVKAEERGEVKRGVGRGTCPSWVASVLLLSLFPGADCRGFSRAFFGFQLAGLLLIV
jgi:hypothetical protein